MAKKKVTHKPADDAKPRNQTDKNSEHQGKTLTPTMEDPVEKLHHLKALNFILLKETFENRQKIESLSMVNKALESDLSGCVLEKNAVVADLNLKENEISALKSEMNELLRDLEGRFVEACSERDSARENFDFQVKETKGLKEKLVAMEKQESDFKDVIFKLKSEYRGLVTEKKERDRDIEDVKKEKDLLDSRLVEAVKENDDLKVVIECLFREKNQMEMEKSGQKLKIDGLEKQVEKLNEHVSKYQNEEKVLQQKVKELEIGYSEAKTKEEEMESEINALTGQKREKQASIDKLMLEKEGIAHQLERSIMEVNDKEGQIEKVLREKKELEEGKVSQEREISELHEKIDELKDDVFTLHEKIDELKDDVFTLKDLCANEEEKSKRLENEVKACKLTIDQAKTKEEEMESEINALTGQKREKQASIEKLMLEKEGIAHQLERSMLEVYDKEGQIEKVLWEKEELEEGKVSQEREISELHEKVDDLKDEVFTLKDLCANEEEKSKRLENEVKACKLTIDQVLLDRGISQKGLEDEKRNGLSLKSKLSQMEKGIKENVEELGKIRNERLKLTEEKKKMESRVESLTNEKELVQKSLLEAKQHMDELRAKMESIGMNSDRALSMLKSTAAMVCQSKNDLDGKAEVVVDERKFDSETEPYVADLEAIKNAFKNKEKLVEDMKRQVEYLQKSAAEERKQVIKKRSFWTVVSSVTTLFAAAAASIAYVTRVR